MATTRTDGPHGDREQERTRKQLRDMDRLLEEMLALPIGDRPGRKLEDLDAPPQPASKADVLTLPRRSPAPTDQEPLVTFLATPEPVAPVPSPDQQQHLESQGDVQLPSSGQVDILSAAREEVLKSPRSQAAITPGELRELVGLTEQQAQELLLRHRRPGLLHTFLIHVNELYDRMADILWPFGGLLKWIGTRYLLGIAGILLLLGSLVWFCLGQLGWTW